LFFNDFDVLLSFMRFSIPCIVADRFALTLEGLCRAVAACVGRGMAGWMILLVWQRVRRAEVRIQGLLTRFRLGKVQVRAVAPGRRVGVSRRVGVRALPRGVGWLLPLVPSEAACFAGQLGAVLAEPEMVALLRAVPQARRVLAPVCRMLGVAMGDASPAPQVKKVPQVKKARPSFLKKRSKRLSFVLSAALPQAHDSG
jgi:hypothetical protein